MLYSITPIIFRPTWRVTGTRPDVPGRDSRLHRYLLRRGEGEWRGATLQSVAADEKILKRNEK